MNSRQYNKGRLSQAFDNDIANSRDDRLGSRVDYETIKHSEHLAQVILHGAKDLMSDESVHRAQQELKSLFTSPVTEENAILADHVQRVLDEQVGRLITSMQTKAELRLLKLLLIGESALIDSRTADYLRRVSQCYLVGLDEQCVIMCRSALEAAFLQSVPDHMCNDIPEVRKKPWPNRDKPEYTLNDRMRAARAKGLLDDGTLKLARYVKNVANDIVHPERDMRRNLDDKSMDMIVLETIQVVQTLSDCSNENQ